MESISPPIFYVYDKTQLIMIKVTYLDHSGFAITTPEAVMIFDYYKDPDKKLEKVLKEAPDQPVVFYVSHHHPDHFNTSIFELAQNRRRTYVLSNDIHSDLVPKKGLQVAWMSPGDIIEQIPGTQKVQAFHSTDSGVAFAITMPDGRVVFHAGDLNDWHWGEMSSEDEKRQAEAHFTKIVNRIASEYPDMYIVMFPVDARMGADYADGARIFLSKVNVDNFFPMHFWGEPQKACDFASYIPAGCKTSPHCLDRPGQEIEL